MVTLFFHGLIDEWTFLVLFLFGRLMGRGIDNITLNRIEYLF